MEARVAKVVRIINTESLIEDPYLSNGRCFGFCCEWIYLCMSQGGVTKTDHLNKIRVNDAQEKYETLYQSEVKLLSNFYKLEATETVRYPTQEGCNTRIKTIKMLFNVLKKTPVGSPVIIGLSSYRGKQSYGHALGWRSYYPNPENSSCIYYEFLDSLTGLWRSDNEASILDHIESILISTHHGFLPTGRTSEHYIYRFIQVNQDNQFQWKNQRLTYAELVWPFKEDGDLDNRDSFHPLDIKEKPPDKEKADIIDESSLRQTMLTQIPTPEEKKTSLLIISNLTTKTFKQNCNFPNSNNKLAKLKYSEFRSIWEHFCQYAPIQQLQQYYVEKLQFHQ